MRFYHKYQREILTVLLALFFIPFFLINSSFGEGESYTLKLAIDTKIPFMPMFVFVYISMYLLVLMPYFFVKERKSFNSAALSYFLVMGLSYLIFFLFPVKMLRPAVENSLVNLIYLLDAGYNCFPSLHVSLSLLSAAVCFHSNKRYWWLFIWAGVVSLSVLFVKQHYLLDVLGGILMSMLGYFFFIYLRGKLK
ncbi:MAG: phosphatase PAP2 family protein [Candidatus Woesearchaeota archaeon]